MGARRAASPAQPSPAQPSPDRPCPALGVRLRAGPCPDAVQGLRGRCPCEHGRSWRCAGRLAVSLGSEVLAGSLALSPREGEVLARLLQGEDERVAPWKLGISRHTVRRHVVRIQRKLGTTRRAELAMRACVELLWLVVGERDHGSERAMRKPTSRE